MHNLQMLNGIGGKISALIERGANLGHIYRNCTEVKGKHRRRLEMNCTRGGCMLVSYNSSCEYRLTLISKYRVVKRLGFFGQWCNWLARYPDKVKV